MQAGSKDKELLKEVPPGDNYLFLLRREGTLNLNLNGDQGIGHSY